MIKSKRLVLARETILHLGSVQLARVGGGSVAGCPASIGCVTRRNCTVGCASATCNDTDTCGTATVVPPTGQTP